MSNSYAQYVIIWLGLSVIVGAIGNGRAIGLVKGFFLSLVLSPLVGIVLVLASKSTSSHSVSDKEFSASSGEVSPKQQMLQELQSEYEAGRLSKKEYNFARKEITSRYS